MAKIKLVTDTSCDLNIDWLKENNIEVLPLIVDIDGELYKDRVEITPREFYDRIKRDDISLKTAAVNPTIFEECFNRLIQENDIVIYTGLASTLSCTFQNSFIAKSIIESDKVIVVDSLNVSVGLGMLIRRINEEIKKGTSIDRILEIIEEYKDIKYIFSPGSFDRLKQGGRISPTAAAIGSLLNIKPVLTLEEGIVKVNSKAKGEKGMIKKMVEFVKSNVVNPTSIVIGHSFADELVEKLKAILKEEYGLEDIRIETIGATLGVHLGEGTIAIFFR